ncbi:MAG: hypothetical protein ACLQVD_20510 [Capsulimonadaceae bacterium]
MISGLTLEFCVGAISQLRDIKSGDTPLPAILRHLTALNGEAGRWVAGSQFNFDALPDSSPETGPTLEKYGHARDFACPDGLSRRFSWHTKLRAFNKRIHFNVDPDAHTVFIGYIGDHLPTAKYGT